MTETILATEVPEERPLLDRVNDYLKGSDSDETKLTIQDIAGKVGLGTEKLSLLAGSNESFQEALKKFIRVKEEGTFDDFDNRADATVLALLLAEAKNKK